MPFTIAGIARGRIGSLYGVRAGQRWVKRGPVDTHLVAVGNGRLAGEVVAMLGRTSEEPFAYGAARAVALGHESRPAAPRPPAVRPGAHVAPVPRPVPAAVGRETPAPSNGAAKRSFFGFLKRDG